MTKVTFGSCWVTKTNVMKVLLPMVNLENNPYINNKEFTGEIYISIKKKNLGVLTSKSLVKLYVAHKDLHIYFIDATDCPMSHYYGLQNFLNC